MDYRKPFSAFTVVFIIFFLLILTSPVLAASAKSTGGQAQVQLQFRIIIPQILYLQVGEAGGVPGLIQFNVTGLPGTGGVAGAPQSIPVKVTAQVAKGQSITLMADSSTPLFGGTQGIPFQAISWSSTGDFSRGVFGGSTNQRLDQWRGSGSRTGTYSFTYDNSLAYPAGTYEGRVTYTLASP
jgi:hypothetical protein